MFGVHAEAAACPHKLALCLLHGTQAAMEWHARVQGRRHGAAILECELERLYVPLVIFHPAIFFA